MSKHRVTCPECHHSISVEEKLLGRQAKCPGCRTVFTLTAASAASSAPQDPVRQSQQDELPLTAGPREAQFAGTASPSVVPPGAPVDVPDRPALRLIATFLKILSFLQLAVGALMIGVAILQFINGMTPSVPLVVIGSAGGIIVGAVVLRAFGELIEVFVSQEQLLATIAGQKT